MALWTPSELGASVVIWQKADVGVTESGGAVSAWANQAPSAAGNFTQSTAGNKPTLVTGALGDAIRFDGTDDYLDGGTHAEYGGNEVSVVVLLSPDDSGAVTRTAVAVNNGGNNDGWGLIVFKDTTVQPTFALFGNDFSLEFSFTEGILSGVSEPSSWMRFLCAGAASFGDGGGIAGTTGTEGPAADRPAAIGARPDGGGGFEHFFDGDIYEIVVCNRLLNVNERERVEGYLSWKWAADGSLLVPDHTYYGAAPETDGGGGGGLAAPIFGGLVIR